MRKRPHQEYDRTRNVIRASPLTEFWTSHLYSLYNVYIRIEKLRIYQQYLRTNTQHYRNYGGLSQCPIAMLKMALPPYLQSWNMIATFMQRDPSFSASVLKSCVTTEGPTLQEEFRPTDIDLRYRIVDDTEEKFVTETRFYASRLSSFRPLYHRDSRSKARKQFGDHQSLIANEH